MQVVVPGPGGATMQRDFSFHACLGPEVSQADVMDLCGIHQLLDAALAGYHVTIFAYGQTGRDTAVHAAAASDCWARTPRTDSTVSQRCQPMVTQQVQPHGCNQQALPAAQQYSNGQAWRNAVARPALTGLTLTAVQVLVRRTPCQGMKTSSVMTRTMAMTRTASSQGPCSTSFTRYNFPATPDLPAMLPSGSCAGGHQQERVVVQAWGNRTPAAS